MVQAAWARQQDRMKLTWLKDGTVFDVSNNNFPI